MRKDRKGQAAMEFLMTYGWAILVVLAAIGALAYFGVLDLQNVLPGRCTIGQGFNCMEHKVTSADTQIRIRNNIGDLSNVTVTLQETGGAGCTDSYDPGTTVNNGDDIGQAANGIITFNCSSTTRFSGDIIISYTKAGEALSHNVTGTIVTQAE